MTRTAPSPSSLGAEMWYASPDVPYPTISAYTFAPRRRACSSSSRTRMPDPSPMTKPSRSLSKGLEAFSGASLRVLSARIEQKPPTPSGVIAASEPPAIIASASPRWMRRKASPTAWAPLAHAVAVAELGPLAPVRIETQPEARLMIAAGMKKGLILRGPPLRRASCSRSMVANPPIPLPMKTPTRPALDGSTANAASFIAMSEAAIANCMKRSTFLTSFFSIQ